MGIAKNRPPVVYHYCGLDTFYKIISNSTIRLSNVIKTNDREEMVYILPLIIDVCEQCLSEYNRNLSTEYKLEDDFVRQLFEYTFNELSINCYVVCFSAEGDLLSQWRGYANDACGVSIGFDTNCFFPLAKSIQSNYDFAQVYYSPNKLVEQIKKYFAKHIRNRWTTDDKENSLNIMNTVKKLSIALLYNTVFYKNPYFEEEAEWRLVYHPFGNIRGVNKRIDYVDRMAETFNMSVEEDFIRSPMEFRVSNNKIISYYDLNFSRIKREFVRKIIIGAKADIKDMDLELFLYKSGYSPMNIEITKSVIPYR